ncbi:MAG TPA: molybdate ABC transporter substrate-binding protein [Synergistaceae bacterium]|jgi:molybdate transport system substrate-binding protein|nr:molybdate ABC transporter substrate-binding protein [Synergistaceae bacterium]
MKKLVLGLLFLAVLPGLAFGEVVVTTGAGYKNMVEKLAEAYRAEGGAIEEMYGGNIGQMVMQIEQGSGATIIISDRESLESVSKEGAYDFYRDLGGTVLVLAWRKGLELKAPEDLEKAEVRSVCHPDPKAAIYGRAASRFLQSSGIGERVAGKLSVVATVPQVFAYLVSGDMDAGFLNRVMIQNGGDKLGGSMEIAEGYPPLVMIAAVVKGHGDRPETKAFLDFLASDKGREILKKNGIW